MSPRDDLKIISCNGNPDLARKVCECLGEPLGDASVTRFPDGEINVKINEDVRGRDVFLVQPTCAPVNHNVMELLVMTAHTLPLSTVGSDSAPAWISRPHRAVDAGSAIVLPVMVRLVVGLPSRLMA